jgi:hypothetical protein
MTVARQEEALLALVEADRDRRCGAILDAARAQAAALAAESHAAARARMRAAFAEERERVAARVAAAKANLETRRRIAQQQRAAALLAAAWQRLPAALAARWREDDARRAWVRCMAEDARRALPRSAWTVVHAPGLPAAERAALAAELRAGHGVEISFVEDPSLRAGLRIAADGNAVDGTAGGLVADRAEVGSHLLALLADAVEASP